MNESDLFIRRDNLLKALRAQQRLLREVGASSELVGSISALVRHLSSMDSSGLQWLSPHLGSTVAQVADLGPEEASSMSIDQVYETVRDENTSRKSLEMLAIHRFNVPKGSMRSLKNLFMLREKILVLADNERTHHVIELVARKES